MINKPEKYDPKRPLITIDLMAWCREKFGLAQLPHVAIDDFREYHVEQIEQCKPKKYANWPRAFQNYIRWACPSGRFYSPRQWEKWLKKAKQLEGLGIRKRPKKQYHPEPESNQVFDGYNPNKKTSKQVVDIAKNHLQNLINKAN